MSEELGIFETIYHNRAMRRLKTDEVPEALLLKLIDAANQAPSGSNMQNGRWIVVRNADQRKKLAELNAEGVKGYAAASGSRPEALPHQDADKRQRMLNAVIWQAEHMHEIPALVIACLETGARLPENYFAGAGAGGSIWPGVQNLLLAARALGLGAAPTTLGLINRPKVKEILNLPDEIQPFCLIPVGYPMGKFGPVTRRPTEEIMRWDRWS